MFVEIKVLKIYNKKHFKKIFLNLLKVLKKPNITFQKLSNKNINTLICPQIS